MSAILGISAFYHDSASAWVVDGETVPAAQEERFITGFRVNSDKYELMGRPAYGRPVFKMRTLLDADPNPPESEVTEPEMVHCASDWC